MSDFKSLLPPNATPLERDLEQVTARLDDVPAPIRDVWNPDTCPADLLPWLAWSFSIDTWQSYWPEPVKRARIKQAFEVQRHKGSVQSVSDVVASFGGSLALKQWWQKNPVGAPHTFDIVLTVGGDVPATAEYQQDIINEVTRTKPERSSFTLIAGVSAAGGVGFQGAIRPVVYARLSTQEV